MEIVSLFTKTTKTKRLKGKDEKTENLNFGISKNYKKIILS